VLGDPNFVVIDADSGDVHTFRISGGLHADTFAINSSTGILSFASDYSVDTNGLPSVVTLDIEVEDSGRLTANTQLEVTVQDVNRTPYFLNLPWRITLPEDTQPGSSAYVVLADDPDTGDVMNYFTTFQPSDGSTVFEFDIISKYNVARVCKPVLEL
jgi:hypothetical protein